MALSAQASGEAVGYRCTVYRYIAFADEDTRINLVPGGVQYHIPATESAFRKTGHPNIADDRFNDPSVLLKIGYTVPAK